MNGANAFIATTKQFRFACQNILRAPSILSALGMSNNSSYSLTHRVWARFSQPRIGMTSARS